MHIITHSNNTFDWKSLFGMLTEKMKGEKHLLPQVGDNLFAQFTQGLSAIAVENGEIVGHATLWNIAPNWYEIGTTYVDPRYRGRHINVILYKELLAIHEAKNILETTTNGISVHVGVKLGFVIIKRSSLPGDAFAGACICGNKKTGSSHPLTSCQLAWNGDEWNPQNGWLLPCHVRVVPATFARHPELVRISDYIPAEVLTK